VIKLASVVVVCVQANGLDVYAGAGKPENATWLPLRQTKFTGDSRRADPTCGDEATTCVARSILLPAAFPSQQACGQAFVRRAVDPPFDR